MAKAIDIKLYNKVKDDLLFSDKSQVQLAKKHKVSYKTVQKINASFDYNDYRGHKPDADKVKDVNEELLITLDSIQKILTSMEQVLNKISKRKFWF